MIALVSVDQKQDHIIHTILPKGMLGLQLIPTVWLFFCCSALDWQFQPFYPWVLSLSCTATLYCKCKALQSGIEKSEAASPLTSLQRKISMSKKLALIAAHKGPGSSLCIVETAGCKTTSTYSSDTRQLGQIMWYFAFIRKTGQELCYSVATSQSLM